MTASSLLCRSSRSKIAGLVSTIMGLLFLSGCPVTSIDPLYEEHDSVQGGKVSQDPDVLFDQSLMGSWKQLGEGCSVDLAINGEAETYVIQSTQGEGCGGDKGKVEKYEAKIVNLSGHRFFDVEARSDAVCDLCLPVHAIFLLSAEKESFSLTPLDDDWLKQALAQKKVTIGTLDHGSSVLTAPSRELKALMRQYADDKTAFNPKFALSFKRK